MRMRIAGPTMDAMNAAFDIVDGIDGWISETGDFPDEFWKKDVLDRYDKIGAYINRQNSGGTVDPKVRKQVVQLLNDLIDGLEGVVSEQGEVPSRYWKRGVLRDDKKALRGIKSVKASISQPLRSRRDYGEDDDMRKVAGSLVRLAREVQGKHKLDGARGHELMPSSIKSKIPKLYSQEKVEDPIVWVKYFTPYGRGTWYVTEFDGRDTMFGWADLGHGELGYISLDELESAERNGLPLVERDLSWKPMPLSKAKRR